VQNQELRSELRKMQTWKEAALQLEQENARLLDLNKVRLDPRLTYITGVVLADSGSPFRQSVLLNVGARDGIVEGWATVDGIGLVGRISGVGQDTARVILVTDTSSRIPSTIQPSGQRAIIAGDNSSAPPIDFLENPDLVRPGDRVISSGDGGVFPAGLLIGQVAADPGGRLRVRLAADFERLEFLRVLRDHGAETVTEGGTVILDESMQTAAPVVPMPPAE
jgi:rod shape-determining protein MreC